MTIEKKLLAQIEAFDNHSVHLEHGPSVLYVESVNGCTFSCVMCPFKKRTIDKISPTLLEKIEPYFETLEVLSIHGEGEPLLGDLKYFVKQSVKNDFVLHMNTTGFLLTEEITDLLSTTRLSIRFSIHAGKAKTYKNIMGYDLDRTKKKITNLVIKAKKSGKSNDFWFSFIVMKENINEIEDFLYLAEECGVTSVRFMQLIPNQQSVRGKTIKDRQFVFKHTEQFNKGVKEEFLNKFPLYQTCADKLGIKIEEGTLNPSSNVGQPIRKMINSATVQLFSHGIFPFATKKGNCLAPWLGQLVIRQNGDVRLCCSTRYTLGNLNNSTLGEIWNSGKMKSIRKQFSKGCIPKVCGYCNGFSLGNYPNNSFLGIKRDESY